METATLFCLGTLRGIRTGSICTVDGSPFKWDEGDYDPHGTIVEKGKDNMILSGLLVAKKLALQIQSKDKEN